MNTNKEAVYNLISLLVKKSGFNMSDNHAEEELAKIKESIEKLRKERDHSSEKKNIQKLIDNLRVRQSFWENNAKIIGNEIITAYDSNKTFDEVKEKIDILSNEAIKGTEEMQVGYIYNKINSLEDEMKSLHDKIDNNNYICEEEKEMDSKYKLYLENKLISIDKEIENTVKEINNLNEIEEKDEAIINKIKDYNINLNKNLETIETVSNEKINSEITFDVWERLEMTRNTIEEKIERSKDVLTKTENMLDDIRKNKKELEFSIQSLEEEKKRCNNKLNNVNNKLEKNDYINITQKMLDISKYDMIKVEIESLKNKKDVIYVDALKVKQELIREWENDYSEKEIVKENEKPQEEIIQEVKEEIIPDEEISHIEEKIEEKEIINEKPKEVKSEEKNKYELDW